MKSHKIVCVFLFFLFTIHYSLFTAVYAADSLDKLSSKLQDGIKNQPAMKIAVMEFPYTDARKSEGSVIIQERLTTNFAQNKKITLIERSLLKKVLGELNLQSSGAIDGETAKKLGKILGADAIVTGTLNDIKDNQVEINARIVQTESAKILSAAGAAVEKTWKDSPGSTIPGQTGTYGKKPVVQIAILLDTSGSMDGLINQARTQLWKIVNELVTSEKEGSRPVIEAALYEYGNTKLPAQEGYLRQIMPFTQDLDKIAKEMFGLKTDGGDEYAGWVIKHAVDNLKWSKAADIYKAVFIAGNEPFTQGSVDFRQAIAEAKAKGIFVNTIYCGSRQQGIAEQWKAGAEIAEGDYTNIDQSAPVADILAPQDDEITKLNAELNNTYIAYGAGGKTALKEKKEMDSMTMAAGKGIFAERAAYQAKSAPEASSSWDVVSAVESGQMKINEVKKDNLPEEMQSMKKEELEKHINQKLRERKIIREKIDRLQQARKSYIAVKEKESAKSPSTLDKAMIDAIRKQASKRGYKFK
ncbi:MAG: VWA domain-containing protein [Elusimicrobia bacterium]|nr:VWA domain-containing protein [Elusimicrobiota bacterium]